MHEYAVILLNFIRRLGTGNVLRGEVVHLESVHTRDWRTLRYVRTPSSLYSPRVDRQLSPL
jgi:hypothetical protein